GRAGGSQEGGVMDVSYYGYLAQTIPPREIARALAMRARRAILRGRPFFFDWPARQPPSAQMHPGPAVLRAPAGLDGGAILREAEAALRGELLLFGQWKRCGSPIDYHRDPFAPDVRYDDSVPAERVDLFQIGADAKAMWEVGRLPQLWRFAQAFQLTGDPSWAQAWVETPRHCRADGTHFESSTGYQRLCAEMFLAAALAARVAGLAAPDRVERAVRGLFRSLAAMVKPSGEMPQIGDLDSCRALPLAPRAA